MNQNFWLDRWNNNEIGFHQASANPLLKKYFGELGLPKGSRVFVPLCGKTPDISWLLENGFRVVGVEFSKLAIEQLFTDLNLKPDQFQLKDMEHFQAENIDIFIGDIFSLSREMISTVDAVYDRAALVALPEETRANYSAHISDITESAPQLLITFEYDQSVMEGPPFSISQKEVEKLYGSVYKIELLEISPVSGGLKGICEADEKVWLLRK